MEKLKGDASSRQYYRGKGFIRVVYPPEMRDSFFNYLKWYKIYKKYSLPVPELYDADFVNLEMIVEDLGDTNGVDYLNSIKLSINKKRFVEEVYQYIKVIQSIGESEEIEAPTLPAEKELNFFLNHCVGCLIPEEFKDFLEELIEFTLKRIKTIPLKLAHRDYHFRNIMVKNKKVYIIDFQDTLFAPEFYDSASLMFDAYIDLGKIRNIEKDLNELDYRIVALQRNLKALGTFCFFGFKEGKEWFKDSIPNGLNYVKQHLEILNPEFAESWEKLTGKSIKNI
ncbi:anomeric MurNAc/GlcNAc kinase [Thermotomaculum hydrothermale]|uniref:Anomeric MurNAc/GlcNAc kinase n=1 Tax=Thermotomaculum hydrothermale TaxID=981385 RepID=A0A7R6PF25_9BACT|nr:phosphotransferase [Thermotomaculum hydrothermale]BBB32539.1 anomeric MurNAc/GlcNAc kinase [Thermotomaculum hydrothermale]